MPLYPQNSDVWEKDCPCAPCDEFTTSDDEGKHSTKCYKVKTGCTDEDGLPLVVCRCSGLKCENGAVPGTYEVGFKIQPSDPEYNENYPQYRCMEVSADWREKMCCGERGWAVGSAFPGGGSKCKEDPDTPDNPGDGDDGGGGNTIPVIPAPPPVNPNLPPVPPPGGDPPGQPPSSPDPGGGNPDLVPVPVCNGSCYFKWVLGWGMGAVGYRWVFQNHTCAGQKTDSNGIWECVCASQIQGFNGAVRQGSGTPVYLPSGVQVTWYQQPCVWGLTQPTNDTPSQPPNNDGVPDGPGIAPGGGGGPDMTPSLPVVPDPDPTAPPQPGDCTAGGVVCVWKWTDTGSNQDPEDPSIWHSHSYIYELVENPCGEGCQCDESHWSFATGVFN